MKNSDFLVGGALVLLIAGIYMFTQKKKPSDSGASNTAAPAKATPTAGPTPVASNPGIIPVPASADISQGAQLMDNSSMATMQSFIR